jgi:murein L,D-transpeptidase YcbB/YkuD
MKLYKPIILLSLLFSLPVYAEGSLGSNQIAKQLEVAAPLQAINGVKPDWKRLQAFYAARQYKPCWTAHSLFTGHEIFSSQAQKFVELLNHADEEGLIPKDYAANRLSQRLQGSKTTEDILYTELLLSDRVMQYISDLKTGRINSSKIKLHLTLPTRNIDIPLLFSQALASNNPIGTMQSFAPRHVEYAQLRKKLADYHSIAATGGWAELPVGVLLKPGTDDVRVPALYERLKSEGYKPGSKTAAYTHYSEPLVQAVEAFQSDHDVKPDGNIGAQTLKMLNIPVEARIRQIEVNMERWRWLPDDLGQRHLFINIAGFNLEAVEDNHPALQMRVIVGEEQHRTPVFSSTMSEVIFHPYWYAPKRLGEEDIFPQFQRNPALAEAKGYEMFRVENGERIKVDLSTINWHKLSKADLNHYMFRQRPGPRNALGAIKFRVTNNDDIYLHDTSNPKLFSSDIRSLSNGCIRLAQPQALAEFVLKNVNGWPKSHVDAVYNMPILPDTEPTAVKLPQPLPVHIMYLTARTGPDDHLHFYDDIYKWDKNLELHGL